MRPLIWGPMNGPHKSATPAPKHNAIVKFSVNCAMCGTTSEQYRINPRLFWHQALDIDLQPRNFQTLKGMESQHPPLYYMWHCPACHFTAGYKYFSDPLKDVAIRVDMVSQRLRETYKNNPAFKALTDKLSENITPHDADFFQAIKLHLLAIQMLTVIEKMVKQNFLNLGRYFLRLGWLHRDLQERPEQYTALNAPLTELHTTLRAWWPDIPDGEASALKQAAEYYSRTLEDSHLLKTPVDKINVHQLIGRIHIKLGDPIRAREILMESIDHSRRLKTQVDEELKADSGRLSQMDPGQRGELVSQSRRLGTLADDAQILMERIREDWLVQQRELARRLIRENAGKTPAEIRDILIKNRVDRGTVDDLAPPPDQKKGLFKLFG